MESIFVTPVQDWAKFFEMYSAWISTGMEGKVFGKLNKNGCLSVHLCNYKLQWTASSSGWSTWTAAYALPKALNFSRDIGIVDPVVEFTNSLLLALLNTKEPCLLEISDLLEPIRSFGSSTRSISKHTISKLVIR